MSRRRRRRRRKEHKPCIGLRLQSTVTRSECLIYYGAYCSNRISVVQYCDITKMQQQPKGKKDHRILSNDRSNDWQMISRGWKRTCVFVCAFDSCYNNNVLCSTQKTTVSSISIWIFIHPLKLAVFVFELAKTYTECDTHTHKCCNGSQHISIQCLFRFASSHNAKWKIRWKHLHLLLIVNAWCFAFINFSIWLTLWIKRTTICDVNGSIHRQQSVWAQTQQMCTFVIRACSNVRLDKRRGNAPKFLGIVSFLYWTNK